MSNLVSAAGLMLGILKIASCAQMERTANIIIKDTIHIFVSIIKIMHILLMEWHNCERWAVKALLIELFSGTKYEYIIGLNTELAKIAYSVLNIIYTHHWAPATLSYQFLDLGITVFEALQCWCCWESMCKQLSMCGTCMRREAVILPWPELWPRYFRSWLQSILNTKLESVWSEMILVQRAL